MQDLLNMKKPLFQFLVHQTFNHQQYDVQGKLQAADDLVQIAHSVKRQELRQMMLISISEAANIPLPKILENFQKPQQTQHFSHSTQLQTPHQTILLPEESDEQIILSIMLECYSIIAMSNPSSQHDTHKVIANSHLQKNIETAKECLNTIAYALEPEEFQNHIAREIYRLFHQHKEELSKGEHLENFTKLTPHNDLLNTLNMLWLKRPVSIQLNDTKFIMRKIKEKAIENKFTHQLQHAHDDVEKMEISRQIRMELTDLAELFPIGNSTRQKILHTY